MLKTLKNFAKSGVTAPLSRSTIFVSNELFASLID